MRISDWRSGVCAADLVAPDQGYEPLPGHRIRIGVKGALVAGTSLRRQGPCCTQQCASNGRSFTPRIKSGANPVDSIARDSAIERGKQRSNAAMMRSAWAKDAATAARSELSSRTDDRRRLDRKSTRLHSSP